MVHRIAYFLHTGEQPEEVDHEDGNRANNRASNLRPATSSGNNRNRNAKVGKDQDLPVGVFRFTVFRGAKSYSYFRATIRNGPHRLTKHSADLNKVISWRAEQAARLYGGFAPRIDLPH
jgi:hypothetical protein